MNRILKFVMLALISTSQFVPAHAQAYTRIRGGCQYFDLDKTYETADLVFIGFLISSTLNKLEPIDDSRFATEVINDSSPVRVSQDLTFRVLQTWKGFDLTSDQLENATITIRERYIMLLKSRFEVGNTYLLFLNKKDEFGDEGWRLYECSKYENLGRGNAHYVAGLLEKMHPSEKTKEIRLNEEVFVTSGSLGNKKIFE